MTAAARPRRLPATAAFRAADHLHAARNHERAGCVAEALASYHSCAAEASLTGEWALEAEALRRAAVLHHQRNEAAEARQACNRSLAVATANGDDLLAAEALNVRAGVAMERGELESAEAVFAEALSLAGHSDDLRARIEQNLGILANVRGRHQDATAHYRRSLELHQKTGNEYRCALAYHNLGMVAADQKLWHEADRHFEESRAMAERLGDLHLQALCQLNHSEVHVARGSLELAKRGAESALALFDQLGAVLDKTDAYRVIGIVYRETGKPALAESRLRSAIDLAAAHESVLCQAEASRELALLYQSLGRNQEALSLLNTAHGLFGRLDARVDLVDVSTRVARLEETFLAVVRDWGQSIESSDTYTFGHCERVAGYAEAVARRLGLDDMDITTVRLGAYLHDLGKIKVPHEILNKPARLSDEEFEVIRMHPIWGVELLESVEFPWDIKPVIRWHHERLDGTGYPDRLRGDEIPLSAQIIGIVDVYDALTTTRSYRPAMEPAAALREMQQMRHHWRDDVYQAFTRSIQVPLPENAAA